MKDVLILGSTGSIGCSALEVLSGLEESHRLLGISCHSNHGLVIEQAKTFKPAAVGISLPEAEDAVRGPLEALGIKVLGGAGAHRALIDLLDPDIVLVAVTGAVGLIPSLATVERGKRLALANKESLVMAGHLLMRAAAEHGAEIIPVDSEHSAVFQALRGEDRTQVQRIILTASGGPFIDLPGSAISKVTPEQALQHPTWTMGRKITIDSATMMNKALEIIEARWLFDLPVERIEVVVHRQSIVHGMAAFVDGSVIAQLGYPDMKVPIRFALTFPERTSSGLNPFDFGRCSTLTFEAPDFERFGALKLGYHAAGEEGLFGTVLNAANETAVELFLEGAISFDEITRSVSRVMDTLDNKKAPSLEEILETDLWAREETLKCISQQ